MNPDTRTNRKNAAGQVVAGGALLAAGTGGNELMNMRLKRRMPGVNRPGVIASATRSARGKPHGFTARTHLPHMAGKLGVRGAQLASLPLLTAGAANLVTGRKTKKLDVREDVVKPAIHYATLQDQMERGQARIGKTLTEAETKRLQGHRKAGSALSLTAGTMGLAALGLRAPGAAKIAVRRGMTPKGRLGRGVWRLAAKEPTATRTSNTLGVGAIGIGSAGSFNYAAQQKLERKRDVSKIAPRLVYHGTSRTRATGIAANGFKNSKSGHFERPAVYTSSDPQEAAKWGTLKALTDGDGRRVRRYRLMAVGPSKELPESKISAYPANQLIVTGNRLGQKVRGGGRWDKALGRSKVRKADVRTRAEGALQTGAGLTVLGAGLSTNRAVDAAARVANSRIDAFTAARRARIPEYGISPAGKPVSRPMPGSPKAVKERARMARKLRETKINQVNRQANVARKVVRRAGGLPTRAALISAGFLGSIPNVWLGSRKVVEKADKHDVDAFMGAGLTAGAAYHGGLYATKKIDRRIERQIAQDPKMVRELRAHRVAYGVPKKATMGDARWIPYNRNYPKSIPGWKWKRAMSYLQGGKTQIAITAPVVAAAGLAGVAINRKLHPKSRRVTKGLSKDVPKFLFHAGKNRRVVDYDPVRRQFVLENPADPSAPYRVARGGKKPPKPPKWDQGQLPFSKSFLRDHASRLSPDAEAGYRRLRLERNEKAGWAAANAGIAGLSGWQLARDIKRDPPLRRGAGRLGAALLGATAMASGLAALGSARTAARRNQSMNKIENKARARAKAGLYGPGRGQQPVDLTSARARKYAKTTAGAPR